MKEFDIQLYLQRIGIKEKPAADLRFLKLIQQSHLYSVPFENLDIHYGKSILLNIPIIYDKIVRRQRGGFCFEINALLHRLLLEIGFNATLVAAGVHQEADRYSPLFDHLATLVNLDEQNYLVDAGFGKFALHPLPLQLNDSIRDPLGLFKLEAYKENFIRVSSFAEDKWSPEYIFSTQARALSDFSERCHFHQTSPHSHFTQKKMITQLNSTGRITLHEDKLIRTYHSDRYESQVEGAQQFDDLLRQYFSPAFLPKPSI